LLSAVHPGSRHDESTAPPRRPRARLAPRQVANLFRVLTASGSVSLAARKSGIGRTALYDRRKANSFKLRIAFSRP
jgi:transcriptional regulator of acetoin/glycerol metabolism